MEYLANRVIVHLRDKPENQGGKRAVFTVDAMGHVELMDPNSSQRARAEKRERLIEWGVVESRQVDAGPTFELFLTDAWRRELDDAIPPDAGWIRDPWLTERVGER